MLCVSRCRPQTGWLEALLPLTYRTMLSTLSYQDFLDRLNQKRFEAKQPRQPPPQVCF